ncbi:MAG: hypothetical protein LQ339_006329 [Xanthoria mediterranea]|nr:MAG: hypothetical protein LQ339_006329 [Xanthoria mediterranea]
MAPQQQYRASEGSSTTSSQTQFTPSETMPSPSATMFDVSQQAREDLDTSDPPLSDLAMANGASPMDLDTNSMPDLAVSFDQRSIDEGLDQHLSYQNGWPAYNHGQTGIEHTGSIWAQPTPPVPLGLDGIGVPLDDQFLPFEPTQRMDEHFAAFDQNFQSPPTTQTNDVPRYVPWPPEATAAAARPWSPEILNPEQLERSPGPQDLLYGLAWESRPQHRAAFEGKRLFTGRELAEERDQDDSSGSDAQLVDRLLPQDNIDPPPSPDPVGPPSQMADRKGWLSRKASTARKCNFENDKICTGCKRKRKPSLITACICIRLPDLTSDFIPASLAEMHEPNSFSAFAAKSVRRWLDNDFQVYVTWGHNFHPIKFVATEVESIGDCLLYQNQYRLNLVTNQFDLFQVPSPPLGIQLMDVVKYRARLDRYLEEILRDSFREFPTVGFRGDDCRVERDFLNPVFEYHEAATGKEKHMVHQALKLVLLTFFMNHSLTLVEDTKDSVYLKLKNKPKNPYGHHTCARLLNKQIKFLLSDLHRQVMKEVLNRLQDTLRVSKRKDLWAPLFSAIVILAMTTGALQVTVRCKEETDKQEGTIEQDDRKANKEIAEMDERFDLLKNLFHQAFRTLLPGGLNPLRDLPDRDNLDPASQTLATKASEIVEHYHTFLVARQVLQAPTTTRDPQTARLIAKFLLLFYPPVKQNQPQPAVAASMH